MTPLLPICLSGCMLACLGFFGFGINMIPLLLGLLLHLFYLVDDNSWPSTLAMAASSSEIKALLDLKRAFNNPLNLSSWIIQEEHSHSPPPPCSGWKGVSCDTEYLCVISVTLPGCLKGGTISRSVEGLSYLQVLDLSGNALTGSIPAEITSLTRLVRLDLHNNLLSGEVPAGWDKMEHLEMVNLTQNNLDGSIPSGLFKASKLQALRLENNRFSGVIPNDILKLGNLSVFTASSNMLTGPIPIGFGSLRSLQLMYASFNQLNGTLPESIGGLPMLAHLDLHHNKLQGVIPPPWSNLTTTLLTLDLSENLLSGEIPEPLHRKFNSISFIGNPDLCATCTRYPSGESSPHAGENVRPSSHDSKVWVVLGIIGASAAVFVLLFLLLAAFLCRKSHSRNPEVPDQGQNWFSPDIQANLRRGKFQPYDEVLKKYSFYDIESHAGFFDTAHVIGKGRFATVYRCHMPDGTVLAMKMFKYSIATVTFDKEIPVLAAIKHRYLLPIKGFYSSGLEKALIYEYFPTGTLCHLLHGHGGSSSSINEKSIDRMPLPDWATRQRIAFGTAQALNYLHRCCGDRVLHMDVKSSNILLETSSLLPRLADYSILHLVSENATERTDDVLETEAYVAPEVRATGKHSDKSDVYSFGVVLLELITGKKPVLREGGRRFTLKNWVEELYTAGDGRKVVDAIALQTSPFPGYLDCAIHLAMSCLNENPNLRPPMSEVAYILEGLASNPLPLRSPDPKTVKPSLPDRKTI
ncbi:hypothetical protein KP509_04G000200 [Ceratopteris richardii]|uniref:Protein kinase domain-containing protein n=1 Tax=Ceratopteris richardii TaxID=49495 RepID=A0A8T2UTJ9_CERRI|nr:hypothetical protein KP509_04G000200 [Ceratopteris richardii]